MPQNPETRHTSRHPFAAPRLDTTVPALVFKTGRNPIHHGTLGIIRSLSRLGVPVYATVEDCLAPAAVSRYLTGWFPWKPLDARAEPPVERLMRIGRRLQRPVVLIPTDDLGAVLCAENASELERWYRFPRLPSHLPRLLSNKRELYTICRKARVPTPETLSAGTPEDVEAFIERARFPVIVKAADSQRIPLGGSSTSIVRCARELLAVYRQAPISVRRNLLFQEYIPSASGEDWIFHGYSNPSTGCLLAFTGRKLRSYPPFAGPTALGLSAPNEVLAEQTIRLLNAIGYAGIMDLDYRFDRRDGQYKLLDFNPRVGANFRMSENAVGVDVVRALHLDLTGRPVPQAPPINGRRFIVESHDWFASLSYVWHGELTPAEWLHSFQGPRELAWFCADDPAPALLMAIRLVCRTARRALLAVCATIGALAAEWTLPPRPRQRVAPADKAREETMAGR